jgi:hypothetical protein
MSLHKCSKCSAILQSIYAMHLHLASDHSSYENGEDIDMKTEYQLEKVGQRTLWLLINKPETRNPKNVWLWAMYLQRYSKGHILIYDEKEQGWAINKENGILKSEDLKILFAEIETARRRRQDYQKADREMYHAEKGIFFGRLHKCILPKEKDIILANEKYEVMRKRYSGQPTLLESETLVKL